MIADLEIIPCGIVGIANPTPSSIAQRATHSSGRYILWVSIILVQQNGHCIGASNAFFTHGIFIAIERDYQFDITGRGNY